ncbi:PIN domain-containing protein [Hydrogenothermus marinus]|uniref:hypothetical protein n=1 Tax=Hydrogenothermus marinus TaxID=133270 RepID=UPI001FE5C466|nr:hypothetical protein [Hydrogenothermus marinus]
MNIKNVFVDANIIIDVFDKKRKNNQSSTKVISYLLSIKEINLYTSCDLLTTVYYILKKEDKKKRFI